MSTTTTVAQMTVADWRAEAVRRFGQDFMNWRFKCVRCSSEWSMADYKAAGGSPNEAYQACIGRHDKSLGCDWALYGLFHLHKLEVISDEGRAVPTFEFADPPVSVPYPEFCHHKDQCAGLGSCPRDPSCCD